VVNTDVVDGEQPPNFILPLQVDDNEEYYSSRCVLKKKKVFIFYLMSRSLQLFLSLFLNFSFKL